MTTVRFPANKNEVWEKISKKGVEIGSAALGVAYNTVKKELSDAANGRMSQQRYNQYISSMFIVEGWLNGSWTCYGLGMVVEALSVYQRGLKNTIDDLHNYAGSLFSKPVQQASTETTSTVELVKDPTEKPKVN